VRPTDAKAARAAGLGRLIVRWRLEHVRWPRR
jgi:hypothetical protein